MDLRTKQSLMATRNAQGRWYIFLGPFERGCLYKKESVECLGRTKKLITQIVP